MDRLYQMEVFVAVAEHECFAAAAQALDISASAVSRTVAALEKELGVELVRRNTRHVDITPSGLQYLRDARRILSEVRRAERAAAGEGDAGSGDALTIRSPTMFGTIHLAPMIAEFTCRFPATNVRVMFEDGPWSSLTDEADIQIYIGELPEAATNAVLIGNVGRTLCAAPAYLDRCGSPRSIADLASHQTIAVGDGSLSRWECCLGGQRVPLRTRPQLTFEHVGAAINASVNGGGITQLLSCQAEPLIESGQLRAVLTDLSYPTSPIYMIYGAAGLERAPAADFAELVLSRMRKIKLFNRTPVTAPAAASDTPLAAAHMASAEMGVRLAGA